MKKLSFKGECRQYGLVRVEGITALQFATILVMLGLRGDEVRCAYVSPAALAKTMLGSNLLAPVEYLTAHGAKVISYRDGRRFVMVVYGYHWSGEDTREACAAIARAYRDLYDTKYSFSIES